MKNRYKIKRFTIIEMLVVMAIIVLLAALLFPTFNLVAQKVKGMDGKSSATTLKQAIETYYTTYGRYPFYDYKNLSLNSVPANLDKTNLKQDACDFLMPYPSKVSNYNGQTGFAPIYKDDYGRNGTPGITDTEYYDTLIKILSAADDSEAVKKYNPKKIVFLSGINAEGKYLDPWGKRLGVGFDLAMENKINPYPIHVPDGNTGDIDRRVGRNLYAIVLVWSFGPNKINECGMTSADDGTNPATQKPFDDLPTWKD